MSMEFRMADRIAIAVLSGDIKASNIGELREEFLACLKAHPNLKVLVLDLSGVSMMDSSGLGLVVSLLKRMSERHGDLRLAALPDKVRMLVEITRLHTVFDIYDTVEKAENA